MNSLASRFRIPVAIVLSFVTGYVFCHCSVMILDPVYQGWDVPHRKVQKLREEAITFFYQTMRELFENTYTSEDVHISRRAVSAFNEYKPRLEPRCRLISVYYYEGFFESDVLFPSGYRFVAVIRKTDKGWRLDSFRHASTESFYHGFK